MIERYPELKSNEAFLRLQRELSDTETRVALARDYFNEIATHLNTRLQIVPDRSIAPIAGLNPCALLEVASFERAPVAVSLGPLPPEAIANDPPSNTTSENPERLSGNRQYEPVIRGVMLRGQPLDQGRHFP